MERRRWMLALAVTLGGAVATVACPSPYADEAGPASDAASDAPGDAGGDASVEDAASDANVAPDAAACDLQKPFGVPVLIPELSSTGQDYSLAFTADERTVILSSVRDDAGVQRLYVATRATANDPFPTPTPFTIPDADTATEPSLTPDGGLLFFALPTADAGYGLFSTTRVPASELAYGVPVSLDELNSGTLDLTPALSADGNEVFFMSSRTGTRAIYRSTRTAAGTFRPPTIVNEIFLDGGHQIAPVLSADGTTLYFAADVPTGLGALDVWVATRASRVDPFGAPHPIPEVSSTASDQPVWASLDGCRLYIASGRGGSTRLFDFFVATRPR